MEGAWKGRASAGGAGARAWALTTTDQTDRPTSAADSGAHTAKQRARDAVSTPHPGPAATAAANWLPAVSAAALTERVARRCHNDRQASCWAAAAGVRSSVEQTNEARPSMTK